MEWWKILILVVLGLVIIILAGMYLFQDNAAKYYKKACRLHKKGEKAYESGNFDNSEKYYAKAVEYRKRARELE
jgi:NADH:ubiquinone oxidoreductase subunit 3 (subunit A)